MGQLYDDYKDPDGFLYMAYSGENVFGEDMESLEEWMPVCKELISFILTWALVKTIFSNLVAVVLDAR